MWPYITVFGISTFLFAISSRFKKNQRVLFEILAIVLLSLLGGFRAINVGTDTSGYLRPLIDFAIKSESIAQYWNSTWIVGYWKENITSQYEPGFTLFIYLVAKMTKSIIFTQTCVQFLIVFPVYLSLKKTEKYPIWFGMLVYDCLLYNHSLNMIRQSIAMSFVLFALVSWSKKEKKRSIGIVIFSCFFHLCGTIGFAIIFLYEKTKDRNVNICSNKIFSNRNFNVAIIGAVVALLLANELASVLASFGITRFLLYISGRIIFMPNQLILRALGLVLFAFNFRRIEIKSNGDGRFYLLMIIYEILVSQLAGVHEFSIRIAQMFTIFNVISYSMIVSMSKYKIINYVLFILYLIIYWMYYFGFGGIASTVPYFFIINYMTC